MWTIVVGALGTTFAAVAAAPAAWKVASPWWIATRGFVIQTNDLTRIDLANQFRIENVRATAQADEGLKRQIVTEMRVLQSELRRLKDKLAETEALIPTETRAEVKSVLQERVSQFRDDIIVVTNQIEDLKHQQARKP